MTDNFDRGKKYLDRAGMVYLM